MRGLLHRLKTYLRMGMATLRYEGALPLPLRVIRVACSPFGTLLTASFCHKDLTEAEAAPPARASVEIARLDESQIGELAVIVADRMSMGRASGADVEAAELRIREKLGLGGVCFVATHEGAIAHYNWVFPGMRWQVWGPIRFEPVAPTDALCDDAFTVKEFRGMGLHGAVHARMLEFLRQSGFTASYTLVSTDNRSSRKALTRLGYEYGTHVVLFESRRSGRTRSLRFGPPLPQFRVLRFSETKSRA